jgi:hypothetical protein
MASPDIVDVLAHQHDEIRRLGDGVRRSGAADKSRLFAEFGAVVHRHELSDRRVVHPAVKNIGASGRADAGVPSTAAKGGVGRALGELQALGTGDPAFDGKFEALQQVLRDQNEHAERNVFPLLRRHLTAQRLHMMAGELHDVQVMGAR